MCSLLFLLFVYLHNVMKQHRANSKGHLQFRCILIICEPQVKLQTEILHVINDFKICILKPACYVDGSKHGNPENFKATTEKLESGVMTTLIAVAMHQK